MIGNNKKYAVLIPAVLLAVFLFSGCTTSREKGYSDGYENGRLEPAYPENIAREQVKINPSTYCLDYVINALDQCDSIKNNRQNNGEFTDETLNNYERQYEKIFGISAKIKPNE